MALFPQGFVDQIADSLSKGPLQNSDIGTSALFASVTDKGASMHFTGNKVGTLILSIAAMQSVLEEVPPDKRRTVLQKACESTGFDINLLEK